MREEETGRLGDKAMKRTGESSVAFCPILLVAPSPSRPVAPSLSRSGLKIRIEGLKKIWKKRYEEKLKLS